MEKLFEKHCVACEGGVPKLTISEAQNLLKKIESWELRPDGLEITRSFHFKNFYQTMAFVNAIAWIANQEDHHPDLKVGYNSCHVAYSTHAIQGLSENDFICAAKINRLVKN